MSSNGGPQMTVSKGLVNPFPGLRPFTLADNSLFFGREEQTDTLLEQLNNNRFVAVIGASGSGKSSLVRAGLIPVLYGGFMANLSSHWRIVTTHPGGGPIDNLAAALSNDQKKRGETSEQVNFRKGLTSALLRTSSLGLVEVIENQRKTNENTLILIDQFEELFRYQEQGTDHESLNETIAFVNLLLEAVRSSRVPIFVLLTMRSDFLGECAQFRDLTKIINESHYLIPRMSREQLKMVIEGPVAVAEGRISPRLLQRLLNEVGDRGDRLTVLQHALMRTWQYWMANKRPGEAIDIQHYEAVGTMSSALSRHADEAYFELEGERLPGICKQMFQAITEKTRENSAIRRPARIKEICALSQATVDEVIQVVEKFRVAERSLLMPGPKVPLDENSIIDISHESLIWIWDRLRTWVDEETQSAQMYQRLADAAEMYQLGQTRTWRPPDLDLALNWKQNQNPTLPWGRRYNPAFERTLNFLDYSAEVYKQEVEREEKRRRNEIRRVRVTAIILGAASVISLLFLFFSILAKIEADELRKSAEEQTELAILNKQEAEEQRTLAQEKAEEASLQREIALENESEAQRQQRIAQQSRLQALLQKNLAEQNEEEALLQKSIAEQQTNRALTSEQEALLQKALADGSRSEAERLRLLAAARAMAIKSKEIPDPQLQGLLASQAFQFSRDNGGKKHDADLYAGLYNSLKSFKGKDFNAVAKHTDGIRSMAYSKSGKYLATAGSDGKITIWEAGQNNTPLKSSLHPGTIFRSIDFSPDESRVLASGGSKVLILDRNIENKATYTTLDGHTKEVRVARFSPKGAFIATASADSTVRLWDPKSYTLDFIYSFENEIRDISIAPNEQFLVVVTADGKLHIQDLKSGNAPRLKYFDQKHKGVTPAKVKISRGGTRLAVGTDQGGVLLFDLLKGRNPEYQFIGHTAEISSLDFSPVDKRLSSSSLDGTVRIWNLSYPNDQPIVLNDHESWVWRATFSPDGKSLVSGTLNGKLKRWPIELNEMASQMCPNLQRNFTEKEWELFVGEGIPYQNTCEKLKRK